MGRKGAVLFACALVACGIDVVGSGPDADGTDGVAPSTSTGAPSGDASSSSPTEVPVVVGDDPPEPTDAAADADADDAAEAGSACGLDGTSCTDGKTCCSKGCNAYSQCGVCSDKKSTPCIHTSDCCRGLWCGDLGQGEGLVCNACFGKGARCDTGSGPSNLLCCSGKCSFAYFYKGQAIHLCE